MAWTSPDPTSCRQHTDGAGQFLAPAQARSPAMGGRPAFTSGVRCADHPSIASQRVFRTGSGEETHTSFPAGQVAVPQGTVPVIPRASSSGVGALAVARGALLAAGAVEGATAAAWDDATLAGETPGASPAAGLHAPIAHPPSRKASSGVERRGRCTIGGPR
jgi:hypothetical protein